MLRTAVDGARRRAVRRYTRDAQTIAAYFWLIGYPSEASNSDSYSLAHPYWSADCEPGGPLDIRPAGSTVWP